MNDDDLLRYSRHLLLDDIGIEGQARLTVAHALVIGVGGLGSPVALFLGSAGVGRITLADGDTVDLTNLQRQIAHDLSRIGTAEGHFGESTARGDQPTGGGRGDRGTPSPAIGSMRSWPRPTWSSIAATTSRRARPSTPRASPTASRWWRARPSASTASSRPTTLRDPASPCYACAFPADAAFEDVACSTMGVFAPLVGIIGSMQAAEALKLLLGIGTSLAGRLQMLDARRMEWTEIMVARNPHCAVCGDP